MAGFRTQRVLHVLRQHHGFKHRRQNRRSRFEHAAQALRRDLKKDRAIACQRRRSADTALQHGLFTKRVALMQSGEYGTRIFVRHLNGARLDEVELVGGFARLEKYFALFEPNFVKSAHDSNGGGVVSCSVRMTVDLRMPLSPGGMFLTNLEIT